MGTLCSETEVSDLWRRFKEDRDLDARERLLLAYAPLVKSVAGRIASTLPAHVDEADIASHGLLGLISAIERFDASRDVKFETYARTRIRGAIIDELRALDWVPRNVRKSASAIERASAALAQRNRRVPTEREIAEELAIPIEDVRKSRARISNSAIVAFDTLLVSTEGSGERVSLLETIQDPNALDPATEMDARELKGCLADAIEGLPERERLVLALYYWDDLTLREIGEVLGVTESRVSQMHAKAVLRLKARLDARERPRLPAPRPAESVGHSAAEGRPSHATASVAAARRRRRGGRRHTRSLVAG